MTYSVWVPRWIPALLAGAAVCVGQTADAPPSPDHAMVTKYCVGCHNTRVKTSGLAFDSLDIHNVGQNSEAWEKVVRKLRTRSMPPAGLPRPDERTYTTLLSSLENSLDPPPPRSRIPAVRIPSAVLTGPNIRTPSETFSRSKWMSRLCCPPTNRATVSTTSPSGIYRLPCWNDICQPPEKSAGWRWEPRFVPPAARPSHFRRTSHRKSTSTSCLWARAAEWLFDTLSRWMRSTTIQIRLQRDRNEHVEGLSEPHEVELMLDGERVKLFTVQAAAAGQGSLTRGQGPERAHPGQGRSARGGRDVPQEAVAAARNRAPAIPGAFQHGPASRGFTPAVYSISVNGPYRGKRSRRHAEPPPDFGLQAGEARTRKSLRQAHS